MKIKFHVNLVYGGWSPKNIETGIGGSEEKLIELAGALAKEHDVTVYMNGEHCNYKGVEYKDHREFKPWEKHDVFVSFKSRGMIHQSINAKKVIHWSTEIEPDFKRFEFANVDRIIPISKYHQSQLTPEHKKIEYSYLWADLKRLDENKCDKEKGTILYSSSFDRGLDQLLSSWGTIREKLDVNKLYITYGWDFIDKLILADPSKASWKTKIQELLKQEGIEMLGRISNDEMCRMYWKSEYWCLPLNNPQAELFCINAIKAQYCNAIPVVRRIGALSETVNEFLDFDNLLGEKASISTFKSLKENKKFAKEFSLANKLKEWQKIME